MEEREGDGVRGRAAVVVDEDGEGQDRTAAAEQAERQSDQHRERDGDDHDDRCSRRMTGMPALFTASIPPWTETTLVNPSPRSSAAAAADLRPLLQTR